ncbi:MAG: hypothetical protein ABJN98_08265 [Roseibium sp.]
MARTRLTPQAFVAAASKKVWPCAGTKATAKTPAELDRAIRTESPFRHSIATRVRWNETVLMFGAVLAGLIAAAIAMCSRLCGFLS